MAVGATAATRREYWEGRREVAIMGVVMVEVAEVAIGSGRAKGVLAGTVWVAVARVVGKAAGAGRIDAA